MAISIVKKFFLLYRFNFEFFLINWSWGDIRILFQLEFVKWVSFKKADLLRTEKCLISYLIHFLYTFTLSPAISRLLTLFRYYLYTAYSQISVSDPSLRDPDLCIPLLPELLQWDNTLTFQSSCQNFFIIYTLPFP